MRSGTPDERDAICVCRVVLATVCCCVLAAVAAAIISARGY